jgi:two-component sensor histidine kinase
MNARAVRIELGLNASPPLVSVTRRFIEEALEKVISDADLISRVAMTTHELLENAAKYAQHSRAELSVTMTPDGDGDDHRLSVQLRNETSPAHVDRLRSVFTELDACSDPMQFYVDLMRRNAHSAETSGLGLARIRVEGEMALSLRIDGTTATLVAQTPVPASGLS